MHKLVVQLFKENRPFTALNDKPILESYEHELLLQFACSYAIGTLHKIF